MAEVEMPPPTTPTRGRSGEHPLSLQDVVQLAVQNALQAHQAGETVPPGSPQATCNGVACGLKEELHELKQAVQDGFRVQNAKTDVIQKSINEGNTLFATMDIRLETLEKEDDRRRMSRGDPDGPGTGRKGKGEKDEKPLISAKVWNIVLNGGLSAAGGVAAVWILSGYLSKTPATEPTPPKDHTAPLIQPK